MLYTTAISGGFTNDIDYNGGSFYAALFGAGYTKNKNHTIYSDLGANESSGAGYVAGGVALPAPTVTVNTGTNVVTVNFGPTVTFSNVTLSARYMVIYSTTATGVAAGATNRIVGVVDFGSAVSSTAANFVVTITDQFTTTNNSV